MNTRYKHIIGGEVSPSAQITAKTGTSLDLSNNVSGLSYNYAAPSNAATFTVDGTKPIAVRGEASTKINVSQATLDTAGLTEPVVYMPDGTTPCTKIPGADFVAGTDMEIWVESMDGVNVRYFFLSL